MAEVKISLDKYLEGQTTRPAVVTRIHRLDPPKIRGAHAIKPLALMIPAGNAWSTGQSIDLAPGQYLVEAYLPNGEVVTQTVDVQQGTVDVHLRGTNSPHEWLSWQHFNGYTPSRTSGTTDAGAKPIPLELVAAPVSLPHLLLDLWHGGDPAAVPWQHLNVPPRPDSHAPMFDPALNVTSYLYDSAKWNQGDRCYALTGNLLAVMPVPWRQTAAGGNAEVDVMLEATPDDHEWPVRMSVVVRDNIMSSVFGYLSSGDLPAAGRVTDTAIHYLFEKVENPVAAAGGAYVLVRLPREPKKPEWAPWLQNLRNWFPWLPDGAILDGWAHLQGIGRKADVKQALTAFLQAVDRGLPFYSSGVKLLYEGLSRIEATLNPKTRAERFDFAYDFARRLALRIDPGQPFTVVRLR